METSYLSALPPEIWIRIIEYAYNPLHLGWHRSMCKLSTISRAHYTAVQYLLTLFLRNPVIRARQNDCLMNKTIINRMLQDSAVMETGFIFRERKYKKNRPGYSMRFSFQNQINGQLYCPVKYSQNKYWITRHYTNILAPNYKPKTYKILTVDIPIIVIPFAYINNSNSDYHGVYIIDNFELSVYYKFSKPRYLNNSKCLLRDRHEIIRRIFINILYKDVEIPVNFDDFIRMANIRDIIGNIQEIITF